MPYFSPALAYRKDVSSVSTNLAWLKLLAMAAMVFDHAIVGMLKLTDASSDLINESLWRLPGRLSIPIFAYLIAYSYVNFTADKKRFMARLWIFALISEPFYSLYFGESGNAILPLALAVTWLTLRPSFKGRWRHLLFCIFVIGSGVLLSHLTNAPSAWIISLLVVCFYQYTISRKMIWLGPAAALVVVVNHLGWGELCMLLVTFWLIAICSTEMLRLPFIHLNKWLSYAFYPGHLALLYLCFYAW